MMIGGYKCTAGRADDDFAFAASAKLCCAGWRGLLKVHRKACDEARWQGALCHSATSDEYIRTELRLASGG